MSPQTRDGHPVLGDGVSTLSTSTNWPQNNPRPDGTGRYPCVVCQKPTARRVDGKHRHFWCETSEEQQRDYKWTDTETAQWAAAQSRPRRGTQRWLALEALVARPDGATDFELAADVHLQQNSIAKRRLDLQRLGYVEATGRHRPAPSGCKAMVWRVTEAGVAYWRGMAS